MTVTRHVQLSAFPDVKPDRPVGPIATSVQRGTNAELMRTIAPLYLTGSVLDVTYGEGKWWTEFTPAPFTYHDKFKVDGIDFTALPEADSSIDTVCFDPPYVLSGSPSSDRLGPDFQNRYGIGAANLVTARDAVGSATLETLLLDGLAECIRVARQWVLVKCMEFSQGSHVPKARSFHDIPTLVTNRATELGAIKNDQIVHDTGTGPGGHNIFDVKRTRRAHSYLLVFEVTA